MNFFKFFRCTNVKQKIQLCNIFLQSLQIIFYLCGMGRKETMTLSFRVSQETAKALNEYISINTLNFTTWIHKLAHEKLVGYGVLDESGEVLGDWLNPETRRKIGWPRDTDKKDVRCAFATERDTTFLRALNNYTHGNCPDGHNRSDCLRQWIVEELRMAGMLGKKKQISKLQKRAA
jgi:hypothetical protein